MRKQQAAISEEFKRNSKHTELVVWLYTLLRLSIKFKGIPSQVNGSELCRFSESAEIQQTVPQYVAHEHKSKYDEYI